MTADREPAAPGAPPPEPRGGRPLVERIGMGAIAALLATLFGGVAAVSLASGEPFLAIMAAIGAVMTALVGLQTLVRG